MSEWKPIKRLIDVAGGGLAPTEVHASVWDALGIQPTPEQWRALNERHGTRKPYPFKPKLIAQEPTP